MATLDDELDALKQMLDNGVVDDEEYRDMVADAKRRNPSSGSATATAAATAKAPDFTATTRTTKDAGGKRSATTKTERTYHATKTGHHSTVISSADADTQPKAATASGKKSKNVAAVLALFLGTIGGQKWYLGYYKEAAIICAISIFGSVFLGLGLLVTGLLGLAEFFIYLTRTPEDFENTYVKDHKGWF